MRWLLPFVALAVGAQTPAISEEKVYGRPAWVLTNGLIRVALLSGGGHIAEVRQTTGDPRRDINPMRVPHYPTIDPQNYSANKHGQTYGADAHSRLSAGYLGHLLCFPFYGPVSSPEEAKQGLGNHGEAPVVEWRKISATATAESAVFEYGAELPLTQYKVWRRVTLPAGKSHVNVEEWVENLLPLDRPFQWMQHATFGPPFVEPGRSRLRVSAKDPAMRDREMPDGRGTGSYTAILLDPARVQQFFVVTNPDFPVQVGYIFPAGPNPWLGDWMENQRNQHAPWNGQVIARGIEFGNSPHPEGLRKAIERGTLDGAPAYGWIKGREVLKNEFRIFLSEPGAQP